MSVLNREQEGTRLREGRKGGEDFFALCWNAKYLRNEGMILLILMVLAELRGPGFWKEG